ncbi:MAG TPA: hypothetical protein VF317_07325 [Dermatophilaceae bacterium]
MRVTRSSKVKANTNGNVKRVHIGCHVQPAEPGDLHAGDPPNYLDTLGLVP